MLNEQIRWWHYVNLEVYYSTEMKWFHCAFHSLDDINISPSAAIQWFNWSLTINYASDYKEIIKWDQKSDSDYLYIRFPKNKCCGQLQETRSDWNLIFSKPASLAVIKNFLKCKFLHVFCFFTKIQDELSYLSKKA